MATSGTVTHGRSERSTRQSNANEPATVIEARNLSKAFRIPTHRIDSLKERVVHPFTPVRYRKLRALQDVTFDVRQGEFFGIVGRNGSGKSTLLKLLASIYRADAGSIRIAGRVAPFIELGVGFNPDLTARENVVLNGVMMGLSRREAAGTLDAVLDFAELEDFADLKLKNYSSGMLVRLAFAVMIQSEAEILLIDEVLAVGDASFQQKCADVFTEMRDGPRTLILVTHDMGSVQRYCHRAMLLDGGHQLYLGDPEEAGREYLRINFRKHRPGSREGGPLGVPDLHAKVLEASLRDAEGRTVENVEEGEPIRIEAVLEARTDLAEPLFNLICTDDDGIPVLEHAPRFNSEGGARQRVVAGQEVCISGTINSRLMPGRYKLSCWVARKGELGDLALQALDLVEFVVYGARPGYAKIRADGDVVVAPRPPAEPRPDGGGDG